MAAVTAGPLFTVAALVGVAGLAKVARPAPTARALREAGLPSSNLLGRMLGLVEVAIALAALALGSRLAALAVCISYLAFALFTTRLLSRQGAAADCGCFGAADAPASRSHVGLDLAFAALAGLAVVAPPGGLADVVADQPLAGVPLVALVAVGTWLGHVAYTQLGELEAAMSTGTDDGAATGKGRS